MLLRLEVSGTKEAFDDLPSKGVTGPKLLKALKHWATYSLEPEIQKNLAGKVLHRRTGHLAARVAVPVMYFKPHGVVATIQTRDVPYALIHEYGGDITPVHAKALTVPLEAALTPAGVLRKTAREWDDTWLHVTDEGKALICHTAPSGDVEPLFILKRKVTIKASHWASKAITASLPELDAEIQTLIDKAPTSGGK